ncbi:hypothetical protein AAVH_13492 [Aphelenchoides avenae]|nr:hypothetical protein AAVH_13492 [Aphelenchus avenae]
MTFYYFPRKANQKYCKVPVFLYTGPTYQIVDITDENRHGWNVPSELGSGRYIRKEWVEGTEGFSQYVPYTDEKRALIHRRLQAAFNKQKQMFHKFMEDFDWEDVRAEDKEVAQRAERLNPQNFYRENA